MELLGKFYNCLKPVADKGIKAYDVPGDVEFAVNQIMMEMISAATNLYARDIMKDKYQLDIDLTAWHDNSSDEFIVIDPPPVFSVGTIPCEICGQTFVTERCHIIPRRQGGSDIPGNIVILCRNHHLLFDNFRLTRQDWEKLRWENKDSRSKRYAETVILCNHLAFWKYAKDEDIQYVYLCEGQDDFDGLREPKPLHPTQELIDEYKPNVIQLIRDNPGILQMYIKKHYLPDYEDIVGYAMYQLRTEGKIRREPKGKSFQLWVMEPL